MKSIILMLLVLSVSCPAFAEDQAPAAAAGAAALVEVGNKLCPVSGEKVGDMGDPIPVEHNGKIYHLCCAMCAKDFKKDPEKYSKIAEDEVAAEKSGS